MTALSSVNTHSSTWSSSPPPRPGGAGRLAEKLMSKFDTDNSDSVDSTELQSLLDDVAQKTGVSSTSSATDLLSDHDSNSDGTLSGEELAQTLQSVLPPPSTLEFAQSRGPQRSGATGEAGDDLFSQVDSDGSGSVSTTELQTLLENMSGNTDSTASSSEAEALFKQLDSDSDGSLSSSEFDAGRPSNQDQASSSTSTASANRPPPPPGGPGGPGRGGSASDSSSQTYDPLDTNEDGVVSLEERLAASSSGSSEASASDPLQALFDTLDSNQDGSISASETDEFVTQLSAQLDSLNRSEASADSGSASGSGTSSEDSSATPPAQDWLQLVQAARREYQAHAQAWSAPVNRFSERV